jgi:hypothetical protein
MNTTSSPIRRLGGAVALAVALAAGSFGVANAQTSTSTTSTTAATATTNSANAGQGKHGGMNGKGGFAVHAPTIASALGITTAELQTQMSAGQTVAQIATAKGVSLQKVIDAYVAEETVEHPDLAKDEVVKRVTDRLNGVRPARPAGGTGTRPAKGSAPAAAPASTIASTTTASTVAA